MKSVNSPGIVSLPSCALWSLHGILLSEMIIGAEPVGGGMLFHFRSTWRFPADLIEIWNAIGGADRWPEWWRTMETVRVIKGPMLPVSVGTIAEYRVHSPLGYHLSFRSEVTAFDLGKWLQSAIMGDLSGNGRWDFDRQGDLTIATLGWDVAVTRPLLARLARLGPVRSAMSWAHDQVMTSGERGLLALLEKKRATAAR